MRLLLIRHGQTIDNVKGEIGTVVPGPPLTELGVEQAQAVVGALSEETIDAIFVSTMLRTQMTAAPLAVACGIEAEVLDGIQEITGGESEGRSDNDAIKTYMGTIFSWWQDKWHRIPGGENGEEFDKRFTDAINAAVDGHDGTVAVFSHGAAIRTWASYHAENITAEVSRDLVLANTGVVILEGSPAEGWTAVEWAGNPLGGADLQDASAPDPTGEAEAE